MESARLSGVLIFDNNPKDAVLYPHRTSSSKLEIVYAPNRLSADDYILEYLDTLPNKRSPILVTSDNELAAKARLLSVRSLSISEFLLLLTTKCKKGPSKEKPSTEGSRQIERYLALFDKRAD